MIRRFLAALGVLALVLATDPAAAGQIKQLSIKDGRITLITQDAPLRQILEEWSRVGKTEIVNIDRLSGPSLTLELVDAPEREALDILLRSATGYLVTPRLTADTSGSLFHRVLIMVPTAPSAAMASNRPVASAPSPAPAQPAMPTDDGMAPGFDQGAGRPPETMFNYANPLESQQQMGAQGGAAMMPGAPGQDEDNAFGVAPGATTPGAIVQPPQPPMNFRNPYGLPAGVTPGSQPPPPNLQPDRSKYQNPGQP